MTELTNKQAYQVNGGVFFTAFVAGYFVGTIARKLYRKYA